MKILLDHNVPHGLRYALIDHDIQTAEYLGWETLRNGDLIRNAIQDSYEMIITCDQSIRFQQNLLRQSITVLTISTNDWDTIRNNVPLILRAIDTAQQGENNLLRFRPQC